MLKRFLLSLALTLFAAHSWAAGTVPGFSLGTQFDLSGNLARGCKLYVVQAGTTSTPQNAYQDSGLTILHPNPLTCDGGGRLPQFFVADGTIKLRLTTSTDTSIYTGDNLLVIGASSGGGGGGSVDPTTVLATGDFKLVYNTGNLSGFVRCNGRTIGNASSGATERANADTQALFSFLYTANTSLVVSGGRGASAAADYAANKTLTLPDCRGRVFAGVDDMGNSTAGVLTPTYWGTSGSCVAAPATKLGATCGGESKVLITGNLPPYTPSGTVTGSVTTVFQNIAPPGVGGTHMALANASGDGATGAGNSLSASLTGGTPQGGTSSPFAVAPPSILITTYIKL